MVLVGYLLFLTNCLSSGKKSFKSQKKLNGVCWIHWVKSVLFGDSLIFRVQLRNSATFISLFSDCTHSSYTLSLLVAASGSISSHVGVGSSTGQRPDSVVVIILCFLFFLEPSDI